MLARCETKSHEEKEKEEKEEASFPTADFLLAASLTFLPRLSSPEYNTPASREDLSQPRLPATALCRWNVKNSFGYILNLSVLILRFTVLRGRIPEGAIKPEVFPARCDS